MKIIYLLVFFVISSNLFAAANDNHFARMPHSKIMELNIEGCQTEAIAIGDIELSDKCTQYQHQAFDKLIEIYTKYHVVTPSWSLCLGQAKNQYSYDYVVMLACMKVVQSVCKEKNDSWENPRQCENAIESGLWINNPRIYEPLDKVFNKKLAL